MSAKSENGLWLWSFLNGTNWVDGRTVLFGIKPAIVAVLIDGIKVDTIFIMERVGKSMRVGALVKSFVLISTITLSGCATPTEQTTGLREPLALDIALSSPNRVTVQYDSASPTGRLHFAQELGGYRADAWKPTDSDFEWVKEGEGERIERRDGQPFSRVTFSIPVDYRALTKSYAPFSPFSDGSALIHSGQFHACLSTPCDGTEALPVKIRAPGMIVGVEGRRTRDREQFVSREEGTNIFVGTLEPVDADGFVAIIDPGLPTSLRQHLDRSLPQSIQFFEAIYGALSFKPELYVSIDDRPESNGGKSTQGGTLPNQIFMHFDGENAKQRLISEEPNWLDWFFAHEAAHLFQQDKVGVLAGDDATAWLHEGGADAMAALALIRRGEAEQSYVRNREREAEEACAAGLAISPLNRASAEGRFDLHYQCGLVIWLALDSELRNAGRDGLSDLNRVFFASVRNGQPWSEPVFLTISRELGVPDKTLSHITKLSSGGYADAASQVAALGVLARQSLRSNATKQEGTAAFRRRGSPSE